MDELHDLPDRLFVKDDTAAKDQKIRTCFADEPLRFLDIDHVWVEALAREVMDHRSTTLGVPRYIVFQGAHGLRAKVAAILETVDQRAAEQACLISCALVAFELFERIKHNLVRHLPADHAGLNLPAAEKKRKAVLRSSSFSIIKSVP